MIRREAGNSSEDSAHWTLISQTDHALLAGQLAEYWGAGGMAPIEPRRELLWAINHHDDGWRDWEMHPGVDPVHGRPRSFTEMELEDSVGIWTGSIKTSAQSGPLETYLVAGHFRALAERALVKGDSAGLQTAYEFIESCESRMKRSLEAWQHQNPAANTREVAEQALAQLRLFDLLSLWFCCAPASQVETVETPLGPDLTLRPLDAQHVQLSPWPLTVAGLDLEVPAVRIPRARYANGAELAAAPSQSVILRWTLQPDEHWQGQNVDGAT